MSISNTFACLSATHISHFLSSFPCCDHFSPSSLTRSPALILALMDQSCFNPAPSEAHPETMDFLSRAWCNFAVQALQPQLGQEQSMVVFDNQIVKLDSSNNNTAAPYVVRVTLELSKYAGFSMCILMFNMCYVIE